VIYRGCVFDLDGTAYRGEEIIPGAPQTIAELRRRNYGVVFLFTDFPQRLRALLQNIGQPA
jgi:ribonucleotide monophosphatase NagD (HAD superfamily)